MPYKDPAKQREFNKLWVAARRKAWLVGKACVNCGATDRLEVDHIDRANKVDHKVWSWSLTRREAELAKCQVLCKPCHDEKSWNERALLTHCSKGHDFSVTGRDTDGSKGHGLGSCSECRRIGQRRRRQSVMV